VFSFVSAGVSLEFGFLWQTGRSLMTFRSDNNERSDPT
jgi:hypothetical protein